ncbi:MAG: hypothetical protein FJY82_00825 [Candidatus Aminicenantes bacterium]|nr:hypothetical protein [Candidatus Aminicenantes bacterium]
MWEEAVKFYEGAYLDSPRNPLYRAALQRAKVGAGFFYLQEARKLLSLDKMEEAESAYAKALRYHPWDAAIPAAARKSLSEKPEERPRRETIEFPIKLKAKDESLELNFPVETSLRSIFFAVGRALGINILFDEDYHDVPVAIDLSGMSAEEALRTLCRAGRNFHRLVDERTVIVVPDQPLKRTLYEVNAVKTFYLSNISAPEVMASLSQLLRTPTKAPSISADQALNSLTVRDTAAVIDLAGRLLRAWDKPKGEVIVMVEIMEVSRTRLRELGLAFDSAVVGLESKPAASGGATGVGWFPLQSLGLGRAENYAVSLPVGYLHLLETDIDTKLIAKPWLRVAGDEEIREFVGQKVPVPKTTYQPFGAGDVSGSSMVSYDYQDVGLDIKITPKVHFENEIELSAEIKVAALGGPGIAGIPIILNREVKGVMRLRGGETQIISGLFRDEERRAARGIPVLKDFPGIGRLFGAEEAAIEQTDVLIALTPFILRSIPLGAEDEEPLWIEAAPLTPGLGGEEAAPTAEGEGRSAVILSPSRIEVRPGGEFQVSVDVRPSGDVGTMSLTLRFHPKILSLKDVAEGAVLKEVGDNVPLSKNIDNEAGSCTVGFTSPYLHKGLNEPGTLAVLRFESKAAGESAISIESISLISPSGTPWPVQATPARVVVR